MHIIISPAKALDYDTPAPKVNTSETRLTIETQVLAKILKGYSPEQLESLMKISSKLSQLNYHRFQLWDYPFDAAQTKEALWAFNGEVFNGIQAKTFSEKDNVFAQDHLRILSGFYGLLRPMDAILPYRLEMGTKLENSQGKNLYEFWGDKITSLLKQDMNELGSEVLINLASNEYFKSINKKTLGKRIISPIFKDAKNGQYKVISIYAKKARGLMTRFIIQNQITNPEDLIGFDAEGYYYHEGLSKKDQPVFVRDYQP